MDVTSSLQYHIYTLFIFSVILEDLKLKCFSHVSMSGWKKMKSSVLCCLMALIHHIQRIWLIFKNSYYLFMTAKVMKEKLALLQLIINWFTDYAGKPVKWRKKNWFNRRRRSIFVTSLNIQKKLNATPNKHTSSLSSA